MDTALAPPVVDLAGLEFDLGDVLKCESQTPCDREAAWIVSWCHDELPLCDPCKKIAIEQLRPHRWRCRKCLRPLVLEDFTWRRL